MIFGNILKEPLKTVSEPISRFCLNNGISHSYPVHQRLKILSRYSHIAQPEFHHNPRICHRIFCSKLLKVSPFLGSRKKLISQAKCLQISRLSIDIPYYRGLQKSDDSRIPIYHTDIGCNFDGFFSWLQ